MKKTIIRFEDRTYRSIETATMKAEECTLDNGKVVFFNVMVKDSIGYLVTLGYHA